MTLINSPIKQCVIQTLLSAICLLAWSFASIDMTHAAPAPEPKVDTPATQAQMVEDFDGTWKEGRWQFSLGHEFPGARGQFVRTTEGHTGQCGALEFDFRAGGNYVAAMLTLEGADPVAGARLWIKKPPGNKLTFRYTDQTGQTLQKAVYAPDDTWADVQVNFTGWTGHWQGANDGVIHGAPKKIAMLIENSGAIRGRLLMDEIRLIPGTPDAKLDMLTCDFVPMHFDPVEGWHMNGANGDPGTTVLNGKQWKFDFTKGAQWVVIRPNERALPGIPQQFRIRFRGNAEGHKFELHLGTHFMTFARSVPIPAGDGEHEVVIDAPPGHGWHWFGGENDGALHGPLRISGLYLSADGKQDSGALDLIDIRVKAVYPPQRACILQAEERVDGPQRQFVATLRNMNMTPKEAVVSWEIRDWSGKALGQGRKTIEMPAAAVPIEIVTPMPAGEHKFVEAVFTAEAPDEMISPTQAYFVAPITEIGSPIPEPESPIGMGLYLYRYWNTPDWRARMDKAAAMAQAAGVKWSREEFQWARIEPQKGQFDWAFYDEMVATAKRHGISVYGILSYWSPWTRPYTPEGIADYCRYATEVVKRYSKDIPDWEVWNEPNIFFWQGPPDMYADLLKQAYAAIKAVKPDARVLGCSTSQIDLHFIRRTMELGAPFDVLTIHPYRGTLYDPSFVANLKEVAELVKPRPVWITEMGWATHVPHNAMNDGFVPVTQRHQAELLARAYLDALGSGTVTNMSWYDFRNDGDDPLNFESNLGIMQHDFSPKPAFRAFATLTRLLYGKTKATMLDLGEGIMAFRFDAPAGGAGITALWSIAEDKTVSLPGTGPMILTDLMGDTTPLKSDGAKVQVKLRADVPVFLRSE